jgi:hypothetical protein
MKVSISLSAPEQHVLEEVLEVAPYANAHALARVAIRLGLEVLRREPGRIPALLTGQRLRFASG